jgi:hypothetical protein
MFTLPQNMKQAFLLSLIFHIILIVVANITISLPPNKPVVVQVVNLSIVPHDKEEKSAFKNNPNDIPKPKNQANKAKENTAQKSVKNQTPKPIDKSFFKNNNTPQKTNQNTSKPNNNKEVDQKKVEKQSEQKKDNVKNADNFKAPIPNNAPMSSNSSNVKPIPQNMAPNVIPNKSEAKSQNNTDKTPAPEIRENKVNPAPTPQEAMPDDIYIFDEKKERKKEFEAKKQALENSNFDDFLNQTIENTKETDDDLLSSGKLTDKEKQIFQSQVKRCWIANDYIKDGDLVVKLNFKMNPSGEIVSLKIDSTNIPNQFKQSVEETIESIFSQEECRKLLLPPRKFSVWKDFSVKLTLKGFF